MRIIVISSVIIGTIFSSVLKAKELDLSGLIQLEARYNNDFDEVNTSDFAVDMLSLGLEAEVHKWVTGKISFIYMEGITDFTVAEAKITLGNTELSPVYLTLGQLYIPFGNYKSHMVSFPLTVEIALIKNQAALIGAEINDVYATVYGFNGSSQDVAAKDVIDKYGINVGFAQETDQYNLDVGIGYITDISDSFGFTKAVGITSLVNYEPVSSLATYLLLDIGAVSFIGQYVTVLNQFNGAEPKAWNVEFGYTLPIVGKETTFAVSYQGLEEIGLALELPKRRYLTTASVEIFDKTTLSLEYAWDKDYDVAEGGTGKDAHSAILQLAVEF